MSDMPKVLYKPVDSDKNEVGFLFQVTSDEIGVFGWIFRQSDGRLECAYTTIINLFSPKELEYL